MYSNAPPQKKKGHDTHRKPCKFGTLGQKFWVNPNNEPAFNREIGTSEYTLENENMEPQSGGLEDDFRFQLGDS